MEIVANNKFLKKLRYLDFFTLDLGKTVKLVNDENNRFRKLSEFEIKYTNLYKKRILQFGYIGNSVKFYEDLSIKEDKYLIFKNDNIYEISWVESEITDLKNYLLETLRKIDEAEEQDVEVDNEVRIKEYAKSHEMWVANDMKNGGKEYTIDQTLSKENYRNEMRKQRGLIK